MKRNLLHLFWMLICCAPTVLGQGFTREQVLKNIAELDEKISVNDKNGDHYHKRGYWKAKLPDLEVEALADYAKAIAINPNAFQSFFSRGMLYEKRNQLDLAIADYATCVKLNSKEYKAHFNLAFARSLADDKKGAITGYTACIGLEPMNGQAYINRGYLYFQLGLFKEAVSDFDRALTIDPNDGDLYLSRALCKEKLKDKTALADFDMAVKLRPNDPEAVYDRALYRINTKTSGDYCTDLRKAYALGYQEAGNLLSEKKCP
ncbi:tetratricopeptide repeat protein [Flavobacterium selenitireducens]|uniref:tetratricopeptide repeat protein n=1 Tax=Flavobacterium selenitireducens TaxID=2722704 RepID=UPI00168A4C8B|nr:tetratricopeptide repeat protein [Flavobacterium selenitireducens]MBD3583360.1 tetratricopeptide repeat protein [Flavobacterium selenitireducens]